ncbi:MAG: recombinase RecT [Rectinemataceae bacterium]
MKANGQDVGQRLPAATGAAPQGEKKQRTLRDWLNDNKERFEQALPKGTIDIDRFIAAASIEIANSPKLMQCDRQSIAISLGQAARYGLEVGALLGQAWLIPYNEKKRQLDGSFQKVTTCHFQLGYKGIVMLARRSKTIKTISAEVVYDHDKFEVELGMGRRLTHQLDIREERGNPIAYYCLVELENGGTQFGVMTMKDVVKHRDLYSKGFQQNADDQDNIWNKNFDEMALKTVIIKTLKLCPMSVEALEAVSREDRSDMRNVTPGFDLDPSALPAPPEESTPIDEDEEPARIAEEASGEAAPADSPPVARSEPARPATARPAPAQASAESPAKQGLF